jgi:HTH-type transcriptional regulator / antitoxin HigA
MNIKPIRTKGDYKAALAAVESLMGAKARTPEGDRLEVLVTLIEGYERQHFPMDLPDAVEAIKFRMEQQGLTPKDLEPLIGRSNRVYEVLSRRRGLTLAMIQKLHAGLGIPAESLLRQTVLTPAVR